MTLLNDLDLRQLEAFSAVISAGSVTAAAKALNRSQPAVSRLIQELEQSLGYPLFIRNGPRIHPSEEALQLHQYVQKALLSLQQIRLRAQEIAHQQHRPLSIAATPALAAGLLPQALAALGAGSAFDVRHQSGEKLHAEALKAYQDAGVTARVDAFIADMAEAFAWADLVVCRSGASTLAELCAVGIGSVLVPFAAAVDDHQTRNAEYLVERGAAVLLKQDETLATHLQGVLRELSENSARRMQMANAARALAKVDAAERIADIILEESK